MEHVTNIEQLHIANAHNFLHENSPGPEELVAYLSDRQDRMDQGEKVWVLRSNYDLNRVLYDLRDGIAHRTLATIERRTNAEGSNEFACTVYGSSTDEEVLQTQLGEAKTWIASRGMNPQESEALYLGMLLAKVDELTT
jgi:hypothetical protein